MDKRGVRIADRIFIAILAVMLAAALALYFLIPQRAQSNSQQLAQFPTLDAQGFFSATFQNDIEQALKDQFVLHDTAMVTTLGAKGAVRTLYNGTQTLFTGETGLVPYGDVYRMYGSDYLTNMPYRYSEEDAAAYGQKAREINAFAQKYANARVFVYYCTRAEDLDWFDATEGIKSFSYSNYLAELLDENVTFCASKLRDFDEYSQRRYKTDHHWTDVGANWGYIEILTMMEQTLALGEPRNISNAERFGGLKWAGSRYRESALSIATATMDDFRVSRYILPAHRTYFGDVETQLGLAGEYAEGNVTRDVGFDQYLNYFGFESKPIRLEFETGEHNLLIVGDSFTRAIREPLASHFKTTVFVNFRLLDEIDLDELMEEYSFDTVLFIGQQDAFSGYFMEGAQPDA